MESVPYLGQTLTRWRVGSSTFLAIPERGARLMNWHVTHADGSIRDVLYWPELTEIDSIAKIRGGNPILFPFNARTFDRGQIFSWRGPDGVTRPMPMHGIARQSRFKVIHLHERGFTAQLQPDETAQAVYPFHYEFSVVYRFSTLGLSCELILTNHDTQPIPWSAGHHFYFTLPWMEGLKRSDYSIRIPAARTLRQDAAGQLVQGPPLSPEEKFDNPALIDALHLGLRHHEVVFGPSKAPGEVRIRLGTQRTPPPEATMVTWTLDDTSPFYCVEPWMGPPNAAEHKLGLSWVAPGQTQNFVVDVAVT